MYLYSMTESQNEKQNAALYYGEGHSGWNR